MDERAWQKKSKKKPNKTHNQHVSVFSALWLCQSLLILGHSALNLNILPKCKLINQQNTRLDAHYFSHIKMWEGRKKTPQKQNQGKHTNSFFVKNATSSWEVCFSVLRKDFWCVIAVCHSNRTLPEFRSKLTQNTSVKTCSFITASYVSYTAKFLPQKCVSSKQPRHMHKHKNIADHSIWLILKIQLRPTDAVALRINLNY